MPRSVAGSVTSVRSNASSKGPRYRTVSRSSNVDESLFGSARKPSGRKPASERAVSRELIATLQRPTQGGTKVEKENDAVVISAADLRRIRDGARKTGDEKNVTLKQDKIAARQNAQQKAADRRARLLKAEEESKKNKPKHDWELEAEQKADDIVSRAQFMKAEEEDDVKKMNSMMLYAKCVTIRDKQIAEKKMIKDQRAAEERRLDEMMEYERRVELQREEEKETRRVAEGRERAKQLLVQIEEREAERMLEKQVQEKEREDVLAHMENMRLEEQQKKAAKIEYAQKLMAEVAHANDTLVSLRQQRVQQEKDEERMIDAYLLEQELQKDRLRIEQEERARQLERQKQIVFEKQEQTINKLAAQDELRARRAAEARERAFRERERQEAEKREKQRLELDKARQQQIRMKKVRLAEQALKEQGEFKRIISEQLVVKEREAIEHQAKHEQRQRIANELKVQVAEAHETKKKALVDKFAEGDKLRQEQERHRARIDAIKARKVKELAQTGVPGKYVTELAGARPTG